MVGMLSQGYNQSLFVKREGQRKGQEPVKGQGMKAVFATSPTSLSLVAILCGEADACKASGHLLESPLRFWTSARAPQGCRVKGRVRAREGCMEPKGIPGKSVLKAVGLRSS